VVPSCGVLGRGWALAGLLRAIIGFSAHGNRFEILYYFEIGICDGDRWWQAPTLDEAGISVRQPVCCRLTRSLNVKMGVQAMVKHAMVNIRKNNTSNPQTGRLWSRRVTEIAADLERSGDTEK